MKNDVWSEWRPFIIKSKVRETADIISFYLYPADGPAIMPHLPGQYINIKLSFPDLELYQIRKYSISSIPNNAYYRISVKKEMGFDGNNAGIVSSRLHELNEGEVIDIEMPTGDFILKEDNECPVAFISGGMGVAPFLSMLSVIHEAKKNHPLIWIHGCHNRESHAFKNYVDNLIEQNPNFIQYIFYDTATDQDKNENIRIGTIDINAVSISHHPEMIYYICGPKAFIEKQNKDLLERGIRQEKIRCE